MKVNAFSRLCSSAFVVVFLGFGYLLGSVLQTVEGSRLEERFAWKQVEYQWPSEEAKQEAIKEGRYIPENNLPLGLERWRNKLFITVPRWKSGVGAPLNYIDLETTEKSPKLIPYPNWESNMLPQEISMMTEEGDEVADKMKMLTNPPKYALKNSTIISTFRVQADECDRLWILDSGLADILDNPRQIIPNTLLIFDLKTDQLLQRYELPSDNVKEDTFIANIIVESDRNDCDNAYAYMPDLGGYGLIVYSLKANHSYRIKHNFFHFDPLQGDFHVGGAHFQWQDGLFAMAIGPIKPDQTKDIYFHALASTKEFKVANRVLQNETFVNSPMAYTEFKYVGDRGMNGHSTSEAYDKDTGVIFYTQVHKDAISCWNISHPYTSETQGLVDSDSNAMIFPNDLKVDGEGNVWVLTDRMPIYLFLSLDPEEVNYRVLTGKSSELIKGTGCDK